jgi:FSR family fosmidomycin resistance protein-like MFS transporter
MQNSLHPCAQDNAQAAGYYEKFHFKHVFSISTAHAAHDTFSGFLPPLLPILIENLAITKTAAGLLSIFMRIPNLFQPFIGYLADHYNLKILVILAPAITAIVMSLVGVAPTYAWVALLVFLAGASSAAIHAVAPVISGRLSGANLGRGMSYWMVGGELGRVLGPLLIVVAIDKMGLKNTPWIMLIGILASLMLYFALKNTPVQIIPKEDSGPQIKAVFKKMGALMVPMFVLLALRGLLFAGSTMYLPTYLMEKGSGLVFSGAALSILEGAGIVGALLGGSISDRIGRKTIIIFSILTTPLFTFFFLFSSGIFSVLWLICIGFSMLSISPPMMALVQESFSESRSLANGIYMAINFITSSTGIYLVGLMGDRYSLSTAISISAIAMLVGFPLIFFLPDAKTVQKYNQSKSNP